MIKKVIIGGGGTGGHVFPAISIANALRLLSPEIDILFVGALGKLEMIKVPEAGYKIIGLPVIGLQRKFSLKIFSFFLMLRRSMSLSRSIIKEFKPDVAIGVGGYASGPILKVASRNKIPIYIQEQNSYAGITNRLLARSAKKIFVAYEGMDKYFPADRVIITGNPVRQDLINVKVDKTECIEYFGLANKKETILILGGSLGAGTINKSVFSVLDKVPSNMQLLWQTGKYYFDEAVKRRDQSGAENVFVVDFINRMDLAYNVADIIISRAGAGTISELAIVGKPVILIPSPNVAEDHQTHNALALKNKNAAILVRDVDAEKSLFDEAFNLVNDKNNREILSDNLKLMAIPDSANRIAFEILEKG